MAYFLGIDVSTTATKTLLVDEAGRGVAVGSAPHDLMTPRPLWSEQDPAAWWTATQHAIRQVLETSRGTAVSEKWCQMR